MVDMEVSTSPYRSFLHQMRQLDHAPSGDIRSWFRYYKWNVEGDVFVPRHPGKHLPIAPGDVLWFGVDDELVGAASIKQVLLDPLGSGLQELWYTPTEGWEVRGRVTIPSHSLAISSVEVPPEQAACWLASCTLRSQGVN